MRNYVKALLVLALATSCTEPGQAPVLTLGRPVLTLGRPALTIDLCSSYSASLCYANIGRVDVGVRRNGYDGPLEIVVDPSPATAPVPYVGYATPNLLASADTAAVVQFGSHWPLHPPGEARTWTTAVQVRARGPGVELSAPLELTVRYF